jgi:hypothetical protein
LGFRVSIPWHESSEKILSALRDFWTFSEISAFKLDKGLPFLVISYSITCKKSMEY